MTPSEARQRLQLLRQEVEATREADTVRIASDLMALMKNRIQNTGVNHEGLEFGRYSEGYRRWRSKNNLTATPFPVVNFKKTSSMWKSVQVKVTVNVDGVTTASILPTGTGTEGVDNLDKMRWNVDRFGPILRPSQEELDIVRQSTEDRYLKLFQKYELL